MLIFGYLGEAGYMDVTAGFVLGTAAWIYVLYEIFKGKQDSLMLKMQARSTIRFQPDA